MTSWANFTLCAERSEYEGVERALRKEKKETAQESGEEIIRRVLERS